MLRISLVLTIVAAAAIACTGERTGERDPGNGAAASGSSSSATTTALNANKPRVAKRLGPAPKDCHGPAPRLVSFGDYGNLVGDSPVWAGFYASFDREGQRYRIERDAPRTEYGWRIKVLWVVDPKLTEPARIKGREVSSQAPLWFEIENEGDAPTPATSLDPAKPGVPPTGEGYKDFPSYLFVPRAGCYALEASWPGGAWRLVFGLGR